MKTSRFKTGYRENSSKLHRAIGDCLRTKGSPFSGYKIYQEYPVNKINPNYPTGAHKFDWVVLDLRLVIEVHGEQHYRPVTFGGISYDEAERRLREQQYRDRAKMDAALESGYGYIEIPYSEIKNVTTQFLWKRYLEVQKDQRIVEETPKLTKCNPYKQELKERARLYRREQYRRQKECLDALKKS